MKENKGGRYKQIQDEQEKIRSFMNESDDIPMIFVDLLEEGSGKLEIWFLEVNLYLPSKSMFRSK